MTAPALDISPAGNLWQRVAADADSATTDGSHAIFDLVSRAESLGYEVEQVAVPAEWAHPPHSRDMTRTIVVYLYDPKADAEGYVEITQYRDARRTAAGRTGYSAPIEMRRAMGLGKKDCDRGHKICAAWAGGPCRGEDATPA